MLLNVIKITKIKGFKDWCMVATTTYHKVTFLPENKTIEVADRITIFETILEHNPQGIQLRFACGAEGICQKCKIRAFQKMGPLTPTEKGCLSEEELQKGIRLACQARVIQDTEVEILYKQPFSILLVDEAVAGVTLNPRICKIYCPAESGRQVSPQRVIACLRGAGIPDDALQALTQALSEKIFDTLARANHGCTAVVIDQELVAIEAGDTTDQQYAVALDIGVNTIAASLLDVCRGRKIAVVIDTNPQLELGENYEQRMSLIADDVMNLEVLSEELLLRLDILILELCRARGISPEQVYEIVVSGSTGMLHLFLKGAAGLMEQNVSGQSPHFSAKHFDFKSSPHARVYALPVISAYAGADITAGILATQLHRSSETMLLFDFGTDIKAVLHHKGRIIATSLPGFGVFDGVGITCGMRPETGAIEHVHIDTAVHLKIIGESLPRGICGSGLIELAAALKTSGGITADGDFADSVRSIKAAGCGAPAQCMIEGNTAFRVYSASGEFPTDIYITRQDVQQVQKVKAAVVMLLRILAEAGGIEPAAIRNIILSGAFGLAVHIDAFFTLGFFPAEMMGRVVFAGNTSKRGAQMALLDRTLLDEAEAIVRKAVCIAPPSCDFSEKDLFFESLW